MSDTGFKSPGKHMSADGSGGNGALDAKRAAQKPPMPSSSSGGSAKFSDDQKAGLNRAFDKADSDRAQNKLQNDYNDRMSATRDRLNEGKPADWGSAWKKQPDNVANTGEPRSGLESHARKQADQRDFNRGDTVLPNKPEKPANPNLGNPNFKPGSTRSADEMNALTGHKAQPKPNTDLGHPGKQSADRGATPPGFDPNKKGPLSDAEHAKAKQAAVNTYSRDADKKWAAKSLDFAHKHRKKIAGGSGIAGVILAMVLGFFALLPLKLESIMKNIFSHEMGRAESYVDRRAQAILFRYIYQRATGTIAADGFYTGNSLIKTIYGNLTINKFEEKLFQEKGIKITKTGPRSIRLTLADGSKIDASSEADLIKHLDSDLKGKSAKQAIKAVVDSTYRPLQFLKRRHLRKYLQNAYNIRKWSIKKQEDKKDPKNPNAPSSTETQLSDAELDPAVDASVESVECLTGDNCPDSSNRNNPDGTSESRPPVPSERTGAAGEGEAAATAETKKGIRTAIQSVKDATSLAVKKSLEVVFGEVITKTLFKAVPIVGWLALAADIDNFFWEGKISKVKVALHSAQFAAEAATWGSLADQFKAGELTGSQINVIMTKLNDIEKSRAVQCTLFKNCSAGTPLAKDKRVGSDSAAPLADDGGICGVTWFATHVGDAPPTSDISSADFWTWGYRMVAGAPPQFIHPVLCAIRIPLNWISGLISTLLGGVLGALTDASTAVINTTLSAFVGHPVDVMKIAQDGLALLINTIWAPVVTGKEVGVELGNAIDAGWDVVANTLCRDVLGCQNTTWKHAYEENLALANEHQNELNRLSPLAALINTDYPESFGSQVLALLPSTPSAAINSVGTTGLAMISNPFHLFATTIASFFPTAHAAAPLLEPNGVQQTGYITSELQDPDLHLALKDIAGPPGPDGKLTGPDNRMDQYDCPVITDPNKSNPCLLDTAAAQLLCAGTSKDDDGGLGGNGDPGVCGDVPQETGGQGGGELPLDPNAKCTPTDAVGCAKALLAGGRLKWDAPQQCWDAASGKYNCTPVKHDLEITAAGGKINNADSCHNAVSLHPRLLYALYQATQKWTIAIDGFVTTHGGSCSDHRYHPQGRAMDVWAINGVRTTSTMSNPAKYNRTFAEFIAPLLAPKGEILQANKCFRATLPSYISDNGDECNHIHVSVQN